MLIKLSAQSDGRQLIVNPRYIVACGTDPSNGETWLKLDDSSSEPYFIRETPERVCALSAEA